MKTIVSLAAMGLMAGYALAQTPTPQERETPTQQQTQGEKPTPSTTTPSATTPKEKTTTTGAQTANNAMWYQRANDDWPASEVIGTEVRNLAGEEIGDVNEIILGNDGKVRAVIIGVGGFLGMGERDVAVAFNSLKIARDSDNDEVITVDATKEALTSAPQWERRRTGG
jgi:sporulation protein YlmC with PRC-barrel domain